MCASLLYLAERTTMASSAVQSMFVLYPLLMHAGLFEPVAALAIPSSTGPPASAPLPLLDIRLFEPSQGGYNTDLPAPSREGRDARS